MIFAEQKLHPPPEVLPFGRALEIVATRVPGATIVPVAIRYEMSMHERPECFLMFGAPIIERERVCEKTRLAVKALIDELAVKIRFEPEAFQTLSKGTRDVNERMDMRRIPRFRK